MTKPNRRKSPVLGRSPAATVAIAAILGGAAAGGVTEAVVRARANVDTVAGGEILGDLNLTANTAQAAESGSGPTWDLPNLDHPRVDYWVERFTTDKRGEFSRFLSRSGRYVPMISAKLEERGLPQDLVYLAMIESGFNPKAYSPAHASGIWQFIAETGLRYGLDINAAVDERNDPVKATDAALDYLTYLHRRFGSWYLAAAGYNTGENRVGRIMRQVTGSERGNEFSYYKIWDRLPRETRDYVPLMVAAARIAKEPEKYGFESVDFHQPMSYEAVVVPAATPLAAIAAAAGTTVTELKELNPHFKLNRTRNDKASEVRIPAESAAKFAASWDAVRRDPRFAKAAAPAPTPQARRYRVKRGENLTVIARRHGTTVRAIRTANGLRSDFIRAGTTLRIPA